MACCNVCYGKCVYVFKVEINKLIVPPYFRREQIWPEGEGGQLVGSTDSSAWAENPSKEECSRRGTVVT